MINKHEIPDDSGNGFYTIFRSPDFEFVDPTKHIAAGFIATDISMMRDMILAQKPAIPREEIEKFIHKEAIKDWSKKKKIIEETKIPENLIKVLTAASKKEQVKLLKDMSISSDQLMAFTFKAWTDFGFSFSQYRSEHHHKGLDKTKMPLLIEVKDGEVKKVGKTELTDGQLKQAVDHRKVVVSKFFDNNNVWHCLFLTYESLKGKETWKNGQPHYHYISDKFGIARDEVVRQLKNIRYNLGNLPHIDLVDYRVNDA